MAGQAVNASFSSIGAYISWHPLTIYDKNHNKDAEETIDDHDSFQSVSPSIGDIKIEYHPETKQVPELIPFKVYQTRQKAKKAQSSTRTPWKPFGTRLEFKFAEVTLRAGLTKNQVNALIQVMQRFIQGEDSFEIRDHDHLCTIWDTGAVLRTTVSHI